MNSKRELNFRPLAAALGCVAFQISLLGWPNFGSLTSISYLMTGASIGAMTSAIYLALLDGKSWIGYIAATALTAWAILAVLAVYAVVKSPPAWTDLYTVPTLALFGSLAAWRQVLIAIASFVLLDLIIEKFSEIRRAQGA